MVIDRPFLTRALRFGVTGVFVTGVHVVVASLWIHWIHALPAIANGVAFLVATLVGLAINTRWSFGVRLSRHVAVRYSLVAVVGLCVSMALSHAVYLAGMSYGVGIAVVVVVMPGLNFLMHHYWTYRVERT